jgi:hypothetical protein
MHDCCCLFFVSLQWSGNMLFFWWFFIGWRRGDLHDEIWWSDSICWGADCLLKELHHWSFSVLFTLFYSIQLERFQYFLGNLHTAKTIFVVDRPQLVYPRFLVTFIWKVLLIAGTFLQTTKIIDNFGFSFCFGKQVAENNSLVFIEWLLAARLFV